MAYSQFDRFLQEATAHDPASDRALGRNRLYGLYTSWCFVSQAVPGPEDEFWAAMRAHHIKPKGTGLRMKGPAAADYIMTSYLGLV
ncbi:hypothetical protein QFZ65_003531 [Arthrobacter sp. B3I9]|uniref:hypothetical protein n=1 Tax=Arthrobacter sp. B3I9 TaxID=3042270 RepID=UPI00278CE87E|nr:hypothetical protein [Arthrobacter sp. B3I9]MDQ0851593.1 hypothetical protein [Arthrobacter sp. B3I9]